jgi:hypothetical protein
MWNGLRPIYQNCSTKLMGFVCHVFNRIDCSKCIRNMVYGYNLSFVESNLSYSAIINSPLSFMGITFSVAPVLSHNICQGTIWYWWKLKTSSPGFKIEANPLATKFIPKWFQK